MLSQSPYASRATPTRPRGSIGRSPAARIARRPSGGRPIHRALALVLVLALAFPVLAEAAPRTAKRADDRVPSAQLQATGSGSITAQGRMVVTGTIPGTGRLVVIDRRGDARAYVAGEELEFRRRRAVVRRASGILYVTGSKVSVQVVGVDVTLSIAGNGTARLRGVGVYRLNAEPERSWSRSTVRVEPRSSSRRGDRRRAERRARAVRAR